MLPLNIVEPVDLAVTSLDILRERVDLWDKRFHDLATDLIRIDSTLADAISGHVENITMQILKEHGN